jgi:hypothetical protein
MLKSTNLIIKVYVSVDLLKVACFVKKKNNIFNVKTIWSKLVSTRRSTVQSLSLSKTSLIGSFYTGSASA